MNLDREKLRTLEHKILRELTSYYYEQGHKEPHYVDAKTGGIYEHKLATRMGFALTADGHSPPEFLEACRMLEAYGYVTRLVRKADYSERGIWPTQKGLDYAEYLGAPLYRKPLIALRGQGAVVWASVAASAVTALTTLIVSALLGLFGLQWSQP